jgi:hypothetical protein
MEFLICDPEHFVTEILVTSDINKERNITYQKTSVHFVLPTFEKVILHYLFVEKSAENEIENVL